MKSLKTLIVLVIFVLLFCSCATIGVKEEADYTIIGTFYMGEGKETASAMVIKDGIILYVGDEANAQKYKSKETVRFEEGQLIIPGISDAHCHAVMAWENKLKAAMFLESDSKDVCVAKMRDYVANNPNNDYYNGKGWIDSQFDALGPTAKDFEGITDKPIIARDAGGHSLWCNQAAMDVAGIDRNTQAPVGGVIVKDAEGNPTGLFKEKAMNLVLSKVVTEITKDYYIPCIRAVMKEYAENGYTAFNEAMINESSNLFQSPKIDAFEELDKNGELTLYVEGSFIVNNVPGYKELTRMAIEYRDSTKGGNFEVKNVKIFMDGVVEGGTAYMSQPYYDIATGKLTNNYGSTYWQTEKDLEILTEVICTSNLAGMPVHIHAIGDQASLNAINCIEKAAEIIGIEKVRECRNIITHLQIVNPSIFAKFEKYNVVANLNPWCNKGVGFYNETEVAILGEERASKEYPGKQFVDSNIHIAFGTDYGSSFTYKINDCIFTYTTRMDPIYPVAESVLRAEDRLSIEQVLDMMTLGSAYQMHRENSFGSFEAGKDATLVVLNQNILEVSALDLLKTKVEKTMFKGSWLSFD